LLKGGFYTRRSKTNVPTRPFEAATFSLKTVKVSANPPDRITARFASGLSSKNGRFWKKEKESYIPAIFCNSTNYWLRLT
jgi:hypothetical protein